MAIGFFSLPGEIRNQIYMELFVLPNDTTIFPRPEHGVYTIFSYPSLCLRQRIQLLRTNKRLNHEASPFLYGMNRFKIYNPKFAGFYFDNAYPTREQLQSKTLQPFLDRIGPQNAGKLRHIRIAFPNKPERLRHDRRLNFPSRYEFEVRQDSIATLKLIQDRCPNIAIL